MWNLDLKKKGQGNLFHEHKEIHNSNLYIFVNLIYSWLEAIIVILLLLIDDSSIFTYFIFYYFCWWFLKIHLCVVDKKIKTKSSESSNAINLLSQTKKKRELKFFVLIEVANIFCLNLMLTTKNLQCPIKSCSLYFTVEWIARKENNVDMVKILWFWMQNCPLIYGVKNYSTYHVHIE